MAMSQFNKEFDAVAEAEKLRNALEGPRTDEATIIKVLGCRPSHQRVEIAKAFKTLCGKELVEKLKTKISGKFLDTCCGLCYDLREYDARRLRDAVENAKFHVADTNVLTIIDILTTRNNDQINAIKTAYNTIYNRTVEADIRSHVSGINTYRFKRNEDSLKSVLLSLLTANRDETVNPDPEVVKNDVVSLYNAGTDESVFNRILCDRSFKHVAEVAALYPKEYKKSLTSVIDFETRGSHGVCLRSIVTFARDPCVHFAEVIYDCVQGFVTNDKRLQHTIITQCEGDMQGIKNATKKMYIKSPEKLVEKNTSGNYRKLLLTLIG